MKDVMYAEAYELIPASNGSLSVTRTTQGVIRVSMHCHESHKEFVCMEITPHNFGLLMSGLSNVEGHITTRNLDKVGMRRETQKLEFIFDKERYMTNEEWYEFMKEHYSVVSRDGHVWTLNDSMRSRDSIVPIPESNKVKISAFYERFEDTRLTK